MSKRIQFFVLSGLLIATALFVSLFDSPRKDSSSAETLTPEKIKPSVEMAGSAGREFASPGARTQTAAVPIGATANLARLQAPKIPVANSAGKSNLEKEQFFDDRLQRNVTVVKGEVMVRFKRGTTGAEIADILKQAGATVLQKKEQLGIYRLKIPQGSRVSDFVTRQRENEKLRLIEPNFVASTLTTGSIAPSDPSFPDQWALSTIAAQEAWKTTTGSPRVTVAVVDTGIDLNHPDLENKLVAGYDFVNADEEALDDHGHGTHVAGIIAADTNNALGIAGLSWASRLMPLKVMAADGEGAYADVIDGILFATDQGAHVINLSIGGYAESEVLRDAVVYARGKNVVVVAAAGNEAISDPLFPAAYPGVVAVSATDSGDRIWPSSNHAAYVKLSAPGTEVMSTCLGGTYGSATGTSCSAAYASGAAALVLSRNPELSNEQVEAILFRGSDDLGAHHRDEIFGYGRINAGRAITFASIEVRNLAITRIRIEPKVFKWRDPVRVIVTVANSGTSTERNIATMLTIAPDGRLNAKVEELKAGETIEVVYDAVFDFIQPEHLSITAELDPVAGEDVSDNRLTFRPDVRVEEETAYLKYEVRTHEWIGYQAYLKLGQSNLTEEIDQLDALGDYHAHTPFGTGEAADTGTTLLEGMIEEDDLEGYANARSLNHFWKPDSSYNDGLLGYDSALTRAQELWTTATNEYKRSGGNKNLAYWYLGRVAHLLEDMANPAHVHLDQHLAGVDNYHKYLNDEERHERITAASAHTTIRPIAEMPRYGGHTPSSFNSSLTTLFFNLAAEARKYDSDDSGHGLVPSSTEQAGRFNSFRAKFTLNHNLRGQVVAVRWFRQTTNGNISTAQTIEPLRVRLDYEFDELDNAIYLYDRIATEFDEKSEYEDVYDVFEVTDNVGVTTYTEISDFQLGIGRFAIVPSSVLADLHQPQLESRAIGYVAALYKLFWQTTHATISGRVTNRDTGAGVDGTVVRSSGDEGSTTTSGGGYYSLDVMVGKAVSVTVQHTSGTFVDNRREYPSPSGAVALQNYVWIPSSGPVTDITLNAPSSLASPFTSNSQINLTWRDNSSNETGFVVEQRKANDGWPSSGGRVVAANASSTASVSITGLSADTPYVFRVRARNGTVYSDYSNEFAVRTTVAGSSSFGLTFQAIDLDTGAAMTVPVFTWVGLSEQLQERNTAFTRSFAANTEVKFACWQTIGTKTFRYMQNGTDVRTSDTWSTVMSGDRTIVLAYGSGSGTGKSLVSLAIEGPSSVEENSSERYKARAAYSDGTSALVTTDVHWGEDVSYADFSSRGVLDTDSVSSDRSVEIRADYTLGSVTKRATKTITIRNSAPAQTFTLTRNVVGEGRIGYSPQANTYAAGTVVSLHGNEGDGYVFSHWSGDASGTDDDTTVRMDRNRTVTAHFEVDTSQGALQVNLSPPQVVTEGAQWKYRNYTAWRNSGNTQDNIPPGASYLHFKDIPGWITPDQFKATVVGGRTVAVNAVYREIKGVVQVTITPPEVAQAGARWRLDGGPWQETQTTLNEVATGGRLLEFKDVPGWATPAPRTITASRGLPTVVTERYGPPAGLPLITSVTPNTGPIEGGVEISIEGTTFRPGATVSFGGVPATGVVVTSETSLTAILPPRARYGSVDLTVTSGGQTATRLAGFTYDIPLGMNMTLLSQIGGSVLSVTTAGNLVFYGEGSSLVAADFTNPNTPVVRGRLPLPGLVKDIEIVGSHAIVANAHWGIQIVDISNPTAMRRVGFYDTPGFAYALSISGTVAFVADSDSVQVIDFIDRSAPVRVGSLTTTAGDIGLTTIGARRIICVAGFDSGVSIVDATQGSSLQLLKTLEAGASNRRLAVSGTKLLLTGLVSITPGQIDTNARIYDISTPENPTKLVDANQPNPIFNVVLINGERIYGASQDLDVYDLSTANRLTNSSVSFAGACEALAISGSTLYAAAGRGGLVAINVASASAPSVISTINQSFSAGEIALSGNHAYIGFGGSYGSSSVNAFPVITTFDVANRNAPQRLSTTSWTNTLHPLLTSGGYLIGGTQRRGITAFSLSNPANPALASVRFANNYVYSTALLGQHILLGAQTSDNRPTLVVLDGGNVQNQTPLSTLHLSSDAGTIWDGLATSGNIVFVNLQGREIRIYDYANVSSPQLLGSIPFTATSSGMVVSQDGKYLFVANYSEGLSIFDCSDRTSPRLLTTYARNEVKSGYSIAISGSLLFYGDQRGVNVLDCSTPASPVLVAAYDTPGTPYDLTVQGNDVFVADNTAGVEILRLGDVSRPSVEITSPTRNSSHEVTASIAAVGGTASDSQGIVRVAWKNDRGGSGAATGTTSWQVASVPLSVGANVITITAEDTTGNVATDSVTINATLPDTTPPVIAVTGPKSLPAFTSTVETLSLNGTAADLAGVESIAWSNDRGGAGAATGTTAWSVEIPLLEGPNRITIVARDTLGNQAQTEILVSYLAPDPNPPTVSITFPTDTQEATTSAAAVNLSGDADDDRSVARVTWANSRGGSGEAVGSRAWHVNDIVLQPGVNVITVTAEDTGGNTATDSLAVTFAPTGADPNRPVLTIQTPTAGALAVEQSQVAFTGQANGSAALTEVVMQLNGGPWLGVSGTGTWTADVVLTPGQNVVRFKAIDATGRESLPAERWVTYRKLAPIALSAQGEGNVALAGRPNLAALEVGRLYTADAQPARGWVFAGWEGAVVSNSKRISFVMEEGAALQANFVENPFEEIAATYRGLVRAEPLDHATSGMAVVTLTKSGSFTTQLVIGGKKLGLKGVFDGTGSFLGRLKASSTKTYDVLLTLDTVTSDAPVTGLLSDGTTTLALNAWPTVKFNRATGTPLAGSYSLAIEPGADTGTPLGYGTARMSVSKSGTVKVASRLANGARASLATAITAGSRAPIYVVMDGGRSSFSAPLSFADKPDSDVDGLGFWSSARVRAASYSFDSFAFETRVLAQRYTSPNGATRVLNSFDASNGSGEITFDDGMAVLTQAVTLNAENKLAAGSPLLSGFKMSLGIKAGGFSGSLLLHPSRRVSFSGVLLQKSGEGVGLLLGSGAEMSVLFRTVP